MRPVLFVALLVSHALADEPQVLESGVQAATLVRKNGTSSQVKLVLLNTAVFQFTTSETGPVLTYTAASRAVRNIITAAGDYYAVNPKTGLFDRYDPEARVFGAASKAELASIEKEKARLRADAEKLERERTAILEKERMERQASERPLQNTSPPQRDTGPPSVVPVQREQPETSFQPQRTTPVEPENRIASTLKAVGGLFLLLGVAGLFLLLLLGIGAAVHFCQRPCPKCGTRWKLHRRHVRKDGQSDLRYKHNPMDCSGCGWEGY